MLVRKKDTEELLAMKILRKEAIIRRNQVEHTKAERDILESIDHPFLLKLRYAFQTPTKLYLVMDYLTGGELFFHLKNARRFKEDRARFYAAEIASGLGHLHSNGIVYRDLKPENILMDCDGHVRLTDFGLSKATKGGTTSTFCGTPEYLAPEVIADIPHTKAVDWWSLGILIYEMLCGLPPFYSDNVNLMYEMIQKSALRIPKYVSPSAADLLQKLLDRDPATRLGSGEGDLKELMEHPWFASLDWAALEGREVTPPFVPKVRGEGDTSNFDKEFTSEPVVDSLAPVSAMGSAKFDGFTFVEKGAMGDD
jgi:serine/threonine protein kinase